MATDEYPDPEPPVMSDEAQFPNLLRWKVKPEELSGPVRERYEAWLKRQTEQDKVAAKPKD